MKVVDGPHLVRLNCCGNTIATVTAIYRESKEKLNMSIGAISLFKHGIWWRTVG